MAAKRLILKAIVHGQKLTLPVKKHYSPEEYLRVEVDALERHELRDGQIVEMPPGSANHSTIISNLIALHPSRRRKQYFMFTVNLRLWVKAHQFYTYPDMMLIRDEIQFQRGRDDVVMNPFLICEVLLPATRAYDRGYKFELYRGIPSLQEYVVIDSEAAHIDCLRKRADGKWELTEYIGLEGKLRLHAINVSMPLKDIYDCVDWLGKTFAKKSIKGSKK